ncbi:MAG: hypothetical protein NC081_05610 [Roseburia sp.]|nr:hypothetical protein [Roseburia sp.]
MDESKRRSIWREPLAEFGCGILAAIGIYLISVNGQRAQDTVVSNIVLTLLGIATLSYFLRVQYLEEKLDYNNGEHLLRFWLSFLAGLALALGCCFLPVSGWPFPAVFVLLTFFSNLTIGILGSSVLMMIPMLITGAGAGDFFLYFISGAFAAILFRKLENDFKIGVPLFLSLFCLLLCEMAQVMLLTNARPSLETFSVSLVNIVINGSLFIGIIKFFSVMVVYQYRERYLELNDTENELLSAFKERSKGDYLQCVHTAHFCERIAKQLGISEDALRCAAYYYKWGEELPGLMKEKDFPPPAREILQEYTERRGAVTHKETAVLICTDTVLSSILYMMNSNQDKPLDYDQIIDTVFRRFLDRGDFKESDLMFRELEQMRTIFKEEKLYYDFLR